MSGGGAGKVYFVLYLAVVLELLIIIVERDEAEEHLHAKQKEAMQIVQSILSQMQAGAGTEGVNTRPQDEITITPKGIDLKKVMGADIKPWRRYIVEVGVTDVSGDSEQKVNEGESEKEYHHRLEKLVKLANVEEFEYQIFYSKSENADFPPFFPTEDYIEEQGWNFSEFEPGQMINSDDNTEDWKFLGQRKLKLDLEKTYDEVMERNNFSEDRMNPVYDMSRIGTSDYAPDDRDTDSIFFYSIEESMRAAMGHSNADATVDDMSLSLIKRSFVVYFQPPSEAGWYKLRFNSRTNKILGLTANTNMEELDDEETVNIGTVQLKVNQLMKVKDELEIELSEFGVPTAEEILESEIGFIDKRMESVMVKGKEFSDENNESFGELKTKITLYGYILRLLTPGRSQYFKPNQGAIDFNVRVVTPKIAPTPPGITLFAEEYAIFDKAKLNFKFEAVNYKDGQSTVRGAVYNKDDMESGPISDVTFVPDGEQASDGKSRKYIAKVTNMLDAGGGGPREYVLVMSHDNGAGEAKSQKNIVCFPTIDEEAIDDFSSNFIRYAYYGKRLLFNHTPPSGNKISPEQYGYYFSTDADVQDRGIIRGLGGEASNKLNFPAAAETAKFKMVWTDPITGEELVIIPEKEFAIKQTMPDYPNINNKNVSVDGDEEYIDVEVTGIIASGATVPIGVESELENQEAKITVSGSLISKVDGFEIEGTPEIKIDAKGKISIKFTLFGELDEEGFAEGVVTANLILTAINPINNKASASNPVAITVKVSYEFTE